MKRGSPRMFALIFAVCFLVAIPFGIKAVHDQHAQTEAPDVTEQTPAAEPTPTPETEPTPTPEAHTIKEFTQVDASYFDDALMIGDSRTVGLMEYGGMDNICYFATQGMSVYNVRETEVNVAKYGKVTLETLLTQHTFGKIYVMLGVNELGYDFSTTVSQYQALVAQIRQWQPDAILFVEANLHLAQKRSDSDSVFNNANINRLNAEIAKLADQRTVFYIDINELFDDENGYLRADYTSDSTHVYGKYYQEWSAWLCTKGIL